MLEHLQENVAIYSFALAVLVGIGSFIGWVMKNKANKTIDPNITQSAGDDSLNIVSKGDVTIQKDR